MSAKRCVFIGSVAFSARCLEAVLESKLETADILCPRQAGINSDYADLGETARRFGREARYFERIGEETSRLKALKPDYIFVFGLSQILPPEALAAAKVGAIGSHPALLPRNRGRHPIVWAIANGLSESGLTFFWLDSGVDSGDIWMQRRCSIGPEDDAGSVYRRMSDLGAAMLREGLPELARGDCRRAPQDEAQANSWRRRSTADGAIDWRMSSRRIHDLVRALRPPYPGAHCVFRGAEVKVWRTQVPEAQPDCGHIEPGKVLRRGAEAILVKTGDGAIELLEHGFGPDLKEGEYIL